MTVPEGYMQDAEGRLIPVDAIKPERLLEDELVRKLIPLAEAQSAQQASFYDAAMSELRAFIGLLAQQYDVQRGGEKGNVTFRTFDDSLRVELAVGEMISFGPEIHSAKALIDECISDWSADAGTELKTIVLDAFRVNKEGRIDPNAVLALRRYSFADERWGRAMEAISNAVRTTRSKQYIRFYRRSSGSAPVQIPLDFSKAGDRANV